MPKKVTIMLDDENVKQIREEQVRLIREMEMSVSFSRVTNMYITRGLHCKKQKRN